MAPLSPPKSITPSTRPAPRASRRSKICPLPLPSHAPPLIHSSVQRRDFPGLCGRVAPRNVRLPLLLRGGEGWGEEAFILFQLLHPISNMKTILLVSTLLTAVNLFAADAAPKPKAETYLTVETAGRDYADQGEFLNDWGGAQVIALGE